jgi:hypothetical protein
MMQQPNWEPKAPAWVRQACSAWGRQKRRIWTGKDWYIDADGRRRYDVDGYAQSMLGRIREEQILAKQKGTVPRETITREVHQRWDEIFFGDGLAVQQTLPGLPGRPNCVLHLHYVFDPEFGLTMSRKARLLDSDLTTYKEDLKCAEFWVWSRLESGRSTAAQLVERVNEIVKESLKSASEPAIHSQNARRSLRAAPEINLAALNRPKLTFAR